MAIKSPGVTDILSIVPVVYALIILLFMNVDRAGKSNVEVTDLNVTGTIVTGVLTSATFSEVPVTCLQEYESTIVTVNRQKKTQILILVNISILLLSQKEIQFIYNTKLLYIYLVKVSAECFKVFNCINIFCHLDNT